MRHPEDGDISLRNDSSRLGVDKTQHPKIPEISCSSFITLHALHMLQKFSNFTGETRYQMRIFVYETVIKVQFAESTLL